MTKFGQAEFADFITKNFVKNRLEKLLTEIFTKSFRPQRTQRKGGIKVLGFILGSIFGGTIGVFAMCLCKAASDADKCMNQTDFED